VGTPGALVVLLQVTQVHNRIRWSVHLVMRRPKRKKKRGERTEPEEMKRDHTGGKGCIIGQRGNLLLRGPCLSCQKEAKVDNS